MQAQKAYQIGLLFTHSPEESAPASVLREAATRRSLNRRVTYRIGVHTITHSFLCMHEKFIRYNVNLALIVAVVLVVAVNLIPSPGNEFVAVCYFTLLHPSKLYYVTYKRLRAIQM